MSGDTPAPIPLFPFPLFTTTLEGHEKRKKRLMTEILQLRSKHPGIRRSNRNAWHSPDGFGAGNEHVQWMLAGAQTFARLALAPYYADWATSELRLGQYWANVVGNGGWNAPHHHFPYHWSGVYYVSAARSPTPKHDELEGLIEFLNPTPWQAVWNRSGNFAHKPQDGLMLLFPASMLHFVHPHGNDELRISIAFNFQVVPKTSP